MLDDSRLLRPPRADGTFAVLSSEAVMRLLPSCEKLTQRTVPVWAFRMVERPSLHQHNTA